MLGAIWTEGDEYFDRMLKPRKRKVKRDDDDYINKERKPKKAKVRKAPRRKSRH